MTNIHYSIDILMDAIGPQDDIPPFFLNTFVLHNTDTSPIPLSPNRNTSNSYILYKEGSK